MKRKKVEDEEGSEVYVAEEKVEANEEEDEDEDADMSDDEDTGDLPSGPALVENPFMDSFYTLSSDNAKDRSKAAQVMIHHCLLSSEANSKDAAYAFRRLLNGLCSGRASARQGNASALASFLKVSFHLNKMEEVRGEQNQDNQGDDSSLLDFVRDRLIKVTDPSQLTGKKKGSEERDYQFGRLFGILAIVRSGILVNAGDEAYDSETISRVASMLASDLTDLFWLKRWMREPAAHGITTLLKLFFENHSKDKFKDITNDLIETVVIPRLLRVSATGEEGESDHASLVKSFCAEQIGIAAFIQAHVSKGEGEFPFPLDQAVVSVATLPSIADALSETSVVVQPRTHFVWDTLWQFLSEPAKVKSTVKSPKSITNRKLREVCLPGEDEAAAVISGIVECVVAKKLLRIENRKGASSGKTTHERRALALCIVRILSGAPYVSSISGPTRLILDTACIENFVLSSDIVRSLFLDVICAGNEKKNTSHLLKPLALDVLGTLSEAVSVGSDDQGFNRRMCVAKALLNAEVRFDARTKTTTVADIMGFTTPIPSGQVDASFSFWDGYFDFLQTQFLEHCASMTAEDSSAQATGYIELLYSGVKMLFRIDLESSDDQESFREHCSAVAKKILRFFMASAFFDCTDVSSKTGKKTKKGKANPLLTSVLKVKDAYGTAGAINYAVRSVVSSRFFAMLADFCNQVSQRTVDDSTRKTEKDVITFSILSGICDDWKALDSLGAKRFVVESNGSDSDMVDPDEMLADVCKLAKECQDVSETSKNINDESKKRCVTGIAVLALSLYIHRLSCGQDASESDDPDADDENDEDEICNALEGLKEIAEDFLQQSDEDSNPLLGLAQMCANLLSSPLGSGNMGRPSSPRLVREAVKFAWLGGLRLSSALSSEERALLDMSVVGTMLEAVGASEISEDDDEDIDEDDQSSSDDDEEESDDTEDEQIFSKASALLEEDSEIVPMNLDGQDNQSDSDVEIDPSKLKFMLEEDSDADVESDILEHHEGADAALAKLIKLKQEARKAGQQAKEKIELGHQLRCTFLLELLFARPDAWISIFRSDVIFGTLLPLLRHRKSIEKSLAKSLGGGSRTGNGEKQALLDKLTSLLKQKICKMKLQNMPYAEPLPKDASKDLMGKILDELKRADSKEHASCCTSCLVFVLKSNPDASVVESCGGLMEDTITEWSTKRTSKIPSNLFDDLIGQIPEVSQVLLAKPLSTASKAARSPFLQMESFRLLLTLFSTTPSSVSDMGKLASESLFKVREGVLSSVLVALQDPEMKKAKRIRVVLKALEKFVARLSSPMSSEAYTTLDEIKQQLGAFEESETKGIGATCEKLSQEITVKVTELKRIDEETGSPGGDWESAKKSNKKKKKKKKNRR